MGIMLGTYIRLYCEVKTQLSIVSLKVLRMIGTQEHNPYKETLFIMLLRSTITWYQKKNRLIKIPRILKFLH